MNLAATNDGALAVYETIANDRRAASGTGPYAEGYRAAAEDIVRAIQAYRTGREPAALERDLQSAEAEARQLARVVAAAERMVQELGPNSGGADALRRLLTPFLGDDLPAILRPSDESTIRLVDDFKAAND